MCRLMGLDIEDIKPEEQQYREDNQEYAEEEEENYDNYEEEEDREEVDEHRLDNEQLAGVLETMMASEATKPHLED